MARNTLPGLLIESPAYLRGDPVFLRDRGIRPELQSDGAAGADRGQRGAPFHPDGTEGLHLIKQPWLNLAILLAKVLGRFNRGLPLACESCLFRISPADGGPGEAERASM